jgi:Helix-turn-helix domain
MQSKEDEDVYLTTDQVMKILGLSRQSISRLRLTNVLTTYRQGTKYLSSSREVEDLLTQRTTIVKINKPQEENNNG